jgi:pimeloyl-ACP methyl ester carboxylesterase
LTAAPSGTLELSDGRRVTYDDIGAPDGQPIVYLHGCPDCRLTRHPDDGIPATIGVRLLAVDRPGYGGSDSPRDWTRRSMAEDVLVVLDALDIDRCAVLGWSSGGQIALACAAVAPQRVAVAGVVASTAPTPFDGDAGAVAQDMLPFVAPEGLDAALALEHIREAKSDVYLRDLDSIPGLTGQLALAMQVAIANGSSGAEFDLRNLMTPWDFDLGAIEVPVSLWYGALDDVVDPAIGTALAAALPNSSLKIIEDASHLLLLTQWTTLLDSLARLLDVEEPTCR